MKEQKSLLKLALSSPLLMVLSLCELQKITSIFTDNRYSIPSEVNSFHTLFCTELTQSSDLQHTASNKKLPEERFLCWFYRQVKIINYKKAILFIF